MPRTNTLNIVIQRHPNVECTTFHVNRRLISSGNTLQFRSDSNGVQLERRYGDEGFDIEPLAQQIAEEIYLIPGVFDESYSGGVSFTTHTVRVMHSRAFDENDIEFEVIVTIAGVLHIDLDQITFELDNSAREVTYVDDSPQISWSA